MNTIELNLKEKKSDLYENYIKTKSEVSKLLQQYIKNFPTYTDHSIEHTQEVLNIASNLLDVEEISVLTGDELYILCMAGILHDIGMCIPENKIKEISNTDEILEYRKNYPDIEIEKYIRDIHHILSYRFIMEEWENLNIPSENYAKAIGLVAQGHRKVNLSDFEVYDPQFFVKTGREYVCLPYLACILRISDELDITNLRTPEILLKYYIPDNEISEKEWIKHKHTIQINFKGNKVIIQAKCTDHNMLAAYEEQYDKIKNVINDCQKVIRSISLVDKTKYKLNIDSVFPNYIFENFDPKGIKYSFDVKNVIKTFIGEELYKNHEAALREAIQNSIDACNYKNSILKDGYIPKIKIYLNDDHISIEDNGQGMDEFIIENYFGKLASSFYQQDQIKSNFEAIGQFGVGVFSYFLISDYIDVETKRGENKSLKFRTDKDPNGYFHFFEHFERNSEGTKLILYLKDKFKSKYNISFMENFLIRNFPFINIPTSIEDSNSEINFSNDLMEIDYLNDVVKHFYFNSQKYKDDFKIISINESNDDFEGVFCAVVPIKYEKEEKGLSEIFDYTSFTTRGLNFQNSLISFSQKGVFINNYESNFHYTFGKINLIKKHKINLNRTDFILDSTTDHVMDIFCSKLMVKIFEDMVNSSKLNSRSHFLKSKWFIKTYILGYYIGEYSQTIIKDIFCFEIYLNNKKHYNTINNLIDLISKVIIVESSSSYDLIKSSTNLPIMVLNKSDFNDTYYIKIFQKSIQFAETLIYVNDLLYKVLDKQHYNNVEKVSNMFLLIDIYTRFFYSELPIIGCNYNIIRNQNFNKYFDHEEIAKFNINHSIFISLYDMNSEKKFNSLEIRLIKEFVKVLEKYFYSLQQNKSNLLEVLSSCNSIITKINSDRGNKLIELTEVDFLFNQL
jgi:molecular chaperone HtpG